MNLGAPELVIILVVLLVLFGPDRIPKMARSIGRAKQEFESGLAAGERDADPETAPAELPAGESTTPKAG